MIDTAGVLMHGVNIPLRNGWLPRDPRRFPSLWSPQQAYVYETGSFTVPSDISQERVEWAYSKYRNKFGEALEAQGFQVLGVEGPWPDESIVAQATTPPDRRKYVMFARVKRRPQEVRIEVPDKHAATMQKIGFRLVD